MVINDKQIYTLTDLEMKNDDGIYYIDKEANSNANGTLIICYPSSENIRSTVELIDGRMDGTTKIFYETGAIMAIYQKGIHQIFFETGILKSEETFSEYNLLVGSKRFYESGNLKNEVSFDDMGFATKGYSYSEDGEKCEMTNEQIQELDYMTR